LEFQKEEQAQEEERRGIKKATQSQGKKQRDYAEEKEKDKE
jgi:hypothetical protein